MVLAFGLLVFFSPLVVLLVTTLSVTASGKVFEREPAVGRRGKPFNSLKFRSPDSDALRSLIARSRIDGLPQLLNVLSGRMSLVGPRPRSLPTSDRANIPVNDKPGLYWDATWPPEALSFRLYLRGLWLYLIEIFTPQTK